VASFQSGDRIDAVTHDPLLAARAASLHDLSARRLADAAAVSVLEQAVSQRRWWLLQWADGAAFVAGLVAQDLQDTLFDHGVRWPRCTACEQTAEHSLSLEPALDPAPRWVCSESGIDVAPLGELR
jgi:hypothetical protein